MQLFARSVYCGEITEPLLGKEIYLAGWVRKRRDHGGLIFIDLEDRTGLMQLVFNPDIDATSHTEAHRLRGEFVISVRGKVVNRSPETINEKLPTGKYELQVETLSIINKAKPLPFQLEDADKVDEELRLKYRYLDLRRRKMQKHMKLRHDVLFAIRSHLNKLDFYEMETPILSKSTPEGARDFLVPSRLNPGMFYALPQSPQIYKQLLMASGMDKYFQIARCFRDEDLRANRQLEFSQLDIEMSFVHEEDVRQVTEGILQAIWETVFKKSLTLPLPSITYDKAFSRFGSDAPDMRFGLEIIEFTELFRTTELKFLKQTLEKGGKVGVLHVTDKTFSRSELDGLVDTAISDLGAKGLLYIRFKEDGSCDSPVSKFLPDDFFQQARGVIPTLTENDTLFIVAAEYKEAWSVLGKLRLLLSKSLKLIKDDTHSFVWVTDFPMFDWNEDDKRWQATHHPFTHPRKGWKGQEPGEMYARAYDLVCNGEELGGGSIRVHDHEMQREIFEKLGISKEVMEDKFGFLLEAQQLGFPPHGGIALGIDRLIMMLAKTNSIREVIAFPKTQSGFDPLMQTPSSVELDQLKELYIKSVPPLTKGGSS